MEATIPTAAGSTPLAAESTITATMATHCMDLRTPFANLTGDPIGATLVQSASVCQWICMQFNNVKLFRFQRFKSVCCSYWLLCAAITCPPLNAPSYGSVETTGNKPGSIARYECDKRFKLVGNDIRKCQKNGYWTGTEPKCKREYEI